VLPWSRRQLVSLWRQFNSDCTVTQLWVPITLRKPEDEGDIFSETSVLTSGILYKVPQDIYNSSSTGHKQNVHEFFCFETFALFPYVKLSDKSTATKASVSICCRNDISQYLATAELSNTLDVAMATTCRVLTTMNFNA
jgi:hypothetical protein